MLERVLRASCLSSLTSDQRMPSVETHSVLEALSEYRTDGDDVENGGRVTETAGSFKRE